MLSLRPSILPLKAHLAMLTLISLWYEFFICDSFAKPFSAMLTLIWFLFGMSSYVILLENLFHNTHIEMGFFLVWVLMCRE